MSKYTFEIDEENAVKIFSEGQESPIIFQPDWPDTTPWANAQEASAWAELFIESMENPEADLLPGYSPSEPTRPRPETVNPETV